MRKPDFDSFADPYDYARALLRFEALAYVESIAEACRTAHVFLPYETRLNVEAAERGEVVPFVVVVRCRCHFDVPIPDTVPRVRWWP